MRREDWNYDKEKSLASHSALRALLFGNTDLQPQYKGEAMKSGRQEEYFKSKQSEPDWNVGRPGFDARSSGFSTDLL